MKDERMSAGSSLGALRRYEKDAWRDLIENTDLSFSRAYFDRWDGICTEMERVEHFLYGKSVTYPRSEDDKREVA